MLFNSIDFAFFLPVVFILYWFGANNNRVAQNLLLLVASYFFYSCWDYRFLALLIFSTCLDYFSGLQIARSHQASVRKMWLVTSVVVNLGLLGFFKYYNFFVENFASLVQHATGYRPDTWTLHIILPIGISFYTFHGLSYVFDIYNKKIRPTTSFIDYALFVGFFPLLVAGPIERATHLLPQVASPRHFNYNKLVDGLKQILWGLFKKIVVADMAAGYVNDVFAQSGQYAGSTLVLGAVVFAFQIYGDFSGYSDIALGTAKLFGFDLLRNFAFPYFSRDIAEFWRRWHISLTTWFRDYLYIPLGGSKGSMWTTTRNVFIIFLVSGFWHGANWTFVSWGLLHALFFLPLLLASKNRRHLDIVAQGRLFPSFKELLQLVTTFTLVTFAWIFFRAESMEQAVVYVSRIFSRSLLHVPETVPVELFFFITVLLVIEWTGRAQQYAIARIGFKWPAALRWAFYYLIIIAILDRGGNRQQFIYFQF